MYRIPKVISSLRKVFTREEKDGKHFPEGVDMLPSPVTRTVAAIAVEPPGTEDGGKTRTPVSSGVGDGIACP